MDGSSRKNSMWRRVFYLYMIALAGIILLADAGRLPVGLLRWIPRYDLWGHFLLYGLMVILLDRSFSFGSATLHRLGPLLLTGLFALLEEFSQILFVSRTFSLEDLVFSAAGILLFYLKGCPRGRSRSISSPPKETGHPRPGGKKDSGL